MLIQPWVTPMTIEALFSLRVETLKDRNFILDFFLYFINIFARCRAHEALNVSYFQVYVHISKCDLRKDIKYSE